MAGAAGQAGAIGARAIFAGVSDFLSGIQAVSGGFEAFANGPLGQANDRLGQTTEGFNVFNGAIRNTVTAVDAATATFSTLTSPIRAIGGAFTSVASEVVEGGGKIVGEIKDIADATAGLSEKGILGVGAIGTSLAALAATAVTESAKFERGMKDIEAVAQVTGKPLDDLDSAVRRVATNFPASVGNIQRSALELSKAGVDISAIRGTVLDLTVAAEQLSGGELTAEQAAEAVGSNLKLFSESFKQSGADAEQASARIINAIVAVANKTRATIPEVVSAITKLGPNVVPLGGSIEQTAALAGAVVAQGPRGQEAGTALANLIQRLEHPSAGASKILDQRQISLFDDAGKARPVIDVINDLSKTYGAAAREISGMTQQTAFSELAEIAQTRVLRGLNLILDNGVESYRDFLGEIAKTDVLQQAATQNEALIRQLEILRNNAVLAGVAFGRDFVSGLGGGVKALNEFLSDGERAQQIAGVIGKASVSVLTGKGDDQARAAVADSPFGDQGTQTFDTLFEGADKVRSSIRGLVDDTGTFIKTISGITFPDGFESAAQDAATVISTIVGLGDDIVKKFNEITPEVVADLKTITGAGTFEDLIQRAEDFGTELAKIFTKDNGVESFNSAKTAGIAFLVDVRDEIGPTILELAKLLRAVEDNAPAFLALADTVVKAAGVITRAIIGIGEALTQTLGNDIRAIGAAASALGYTLSHSNAANYAHENALEHTERVAHGRGGDPIPLTLTSSPADAGQGGGGLTGGVLEGATVTNSRMNESSRVSAAYAATLAQLAANDEEAAASSALLGDSIGNTKGHFEDLAKEAREAAAAQKKLDEASNSLQSTIRTLGKDVTDTGSSFNRTIEGARARWLDGIDQIAESTQDAFTRIQRTAEQGRSRAVEAFSLQTDRSGGFGISLDDNNQVIIDFENQTRGFNTVFRQGQEDRLRIFQQGIEDQSTQRHQFDEDDTTSAQRHGQDLERLETQNQQDLTQARQHGQEDRDRIRQQAEEDELTGYQRSQERQLTAFQRTQELQSTARSRSRDDQHAQQDLAESLAKATSPTQRTQLLTDFSSAQRRTAQTRREQDEDTRYSQQQQDLLTKFRQGQEDDLTKHRRDVEDGDIAHRREVETADINFRRLLEVDMIRFRRGLEDAESFRRRQAAVLETAQTRRDQLAVVGQQRLQGDELTLFNFLNERIPELQRNLKEIDTSAQNQTEQAAETAARGILRTTNTYNREVAGAVQTGSDALQKLQERFTNEAANLLQRVPPEKREELQRQIDAQQAVLSAEITLARSRQSGAASGVNSDIDQATQRALAQVAPLSPNISTIQQIFGSGQTGATTSSTLLESPQVDRLTTALNNLSTQIDKIKPGVQIDRLEQNFETPTSPDQAIQGVRATAGVS